MLRGTWYPGKTTPTAGLTCSQAVVPAVAVNEMGALVVESRTVWPVPGGRTGTVKVRLVALSASVDGAALTVSVTGMLTGATTPVTVTVTLALYIPTPRLVGLARRLRLPGSFPLDGLTVSHNDEPPGGAGGTTAVKAGVPVLARTATVAAEGSAAPI
jgi:hypothetical protein